MNQDKLKKAMEIFHIAKAKMKENESFLATHIEEMLKGSPTVGSEITSIDDIIDDTFYTIDYLGETDCVVVHFGNSSFIYYRASTRMVLYSFEMRNDEIMFVYSTTLEEDAVEEIITFYDDMVRSSEYRFRHLNLE